MHRFFLLLLLPLFACHQVPKERISPFTVESNIKLNGDTLTVIVTNPVGCPVEFVGHSKKPELHQQLETAFPFLLAPQASDTLVLVLTDGPFALEDMKFKLLYGHTADSTDTDRLSLPFPSGQAYRIEQGYHGSYSHNKPRSRYAIDFAIPIGDTICAAASGVVIESIEAYKYGGNSTKWLPFANLITLWHPERNLYTQYVHLVHQGSFVEVGDTVAAGQPIGQAGMTGFTGSPHLHFNVARNIEQEWTSTPASFGDKGIDGIELKYGASCKNTSPPYQEERDAN
jgi:murein DD-endopeptidase MepM/ murein hydrolase activator NlpD